MVTETQIHEMTEEDEWEEINSSTNQDVAEGGFLGAVGGAIVGGLAGGPIGAVIGAVIGGVASAGAVDLVDKYDHDTAAELVDHPDLSAVIPETVLAETALPAVTVLDRSTLIRVRAYALYEQRGRADGLDVEDWLKAEEELFP